MKAATDFEALARRLTVRAAAAATARVTGLRLVRQQDERHWRRANLLWPLFGRG